MKPLAFMDKLLDGEQVEWLNLSEVANYSPTRVDAKELDETTFVGVDNLLSDKRGRIEAKYLPNTARLTAFEVGDVLIGNIRPYLKKIWRATFSGGCSGDVLAIRVKEDSKLKVESEFLYYILSSDYFFAYNMQNAKGAKMPRGNKAAVMSFPIPIPCPDNPEKSLAIQAEIVRILDTFTELTTELTTELNMRKKQYNHYRDQLLSFPCSSVGTESEVEWKTLGDVVEIKRGKRLVKSQLKNSGKYAVFQNSMKPLGFYHENNVKAGTTFIICAGSAGEIGHSIYDFWAADDVYYFNTPKVLNNKYLYYFLLTKQFKIKSQVRRSSVPRLSKISFEKISIPIPSLNQQARIVTILDKFDTLTTSLQEGLPHEIELRQKQYEYYRDLLLSFPKPDEVVA